MRRCCRAGRTSGRGQLVFAGRALRPTAEALHKNSGNSWPPRTRAARPRPSSDELSAMQASPADTPQYLAAIGSEADRMARLVDDLLLLAGSDAGTWRMRMEPVDADALVIGAHEQFAPLVKARGLRLALDLPEETLPPLWGDAGRLRQLLLVFISNACATRPPAARHAARPRGKRPGTAFGGGPRPRRAGCGKGTCVRALLPRRQKPHGQGALWAGSLCGTGTGRAARRRYLLTDTPGGGATFTLRLPVRARKAQHTHTGPHETAKRPRRPVLFRAVGGILRPACHALLQVLPVGAHGFGIPGIAVLRDARTRNIVDINKPKRSR